MMLTLGGLTGCASVPAGGASAGRPDDGYRARGNEPFWTLEFADASMAFSRLGNPTVVSAARPDAERLDTGWTFSTTFGGRPYLVRIENRHCNDSMSGSPFPHTVTVIAGDENYAGCGGYPTALLTGEEWSVTQLDGIETIETRRPSLLFAPDGSLTGNGSCNRFRATYEVTGEGIAIGPAAATRMACAEADLNEQEVRFFAFLELVTRFDIAADGSLELLAGDRRVIAAQR